MATSAFPNNAIAELASVLGEDNVRTLVRTFLRDFPVSFQALTAGDRTDRHRRAHSMKSSSRLMGALELSRYMAGLEARFSDEPDADVSTIARASVQRISELAPQAARLNKQTLRALMHDQLPVLLTTAYDYADGIEHREGIAAFLEKRAPTF